MKRSSGEGTVFWDEKAQRFKAKTSARGGRRRKTFTGRTRREALRRRDDWQAKHGILPQSASGRGLV